MTMAAFKSIDSSAEPTAKAFNSLGISEQNAFLHYYKLA